MRIWNSLHIPRVTILKSQSEVSVFIAIFLQEAMELYSLADISEFNRKRHQVSQGERAAADSGVGWQYASGSSNDTADVFGSSQSQSTAPTFSLPSEAELFTTPQKNRARQQAARVC
jgi:hypothetical protein